MKPTYDDKLLLAEPCLSACGRLVYPPGRSCPSCLSAGAGAPLGSADLMQPAGPRVALPQRTD